MLQSSNYKLYLPCTFPLLLHTLQIQSRLGQYLIDIRLAMANHLVIAFIRMIVAFNLDGSVEVIVGQSLSRYLERPEFRVQIIIFALGLVHPQPRLVLFDPTEDKERVRF